MTSTLVTVSSPPILAVRFPSNSEASRSSQLSYCPCFKARPLCRTTFLSPSNVVHDGLFQFKRRHRFCPVHAKDINAGQWSNEKQRLSHWTSTSLNAVLEGLPKPVKDFPWPTVVVYLIQTILGLAVAVVKYLCVPVLALSSLSEMSYCAHERKMAYIPVPFVTGVAVANIMKQTAIDVSPDILEHDHPWHLLVMALFFVLLKLPGPYYPYLGRLIIPHFANGGLWGTLWFIFQWYKVVRK